ncbi:HDOD domain-containing protein [Ferrimicrobium acidiphilum]|uniref:HDOD domain-containing protein n=1 Tax=Ferrimicrobium acidiphilum TaxID=121039 RepID=UPI0023EF9A05|nr:HDOD domain-containing protein [Ferrimicrobium acidiphilum]
MDLVSAEDINQKIEVFEASHAVAGRLLTLVERDDIGAREVATLVSADPILVSRIMRMANSAFYGTGGRVRELHAGVAMLGFEAVKSLALASFVEGSGTVTPQDWDHSITSAVAAAEVARTIGADQQQAFSLALLHDIGEAVIASLDPSFHEVLDSRRSMPLTADAESEMLSSERKRYGLHHAAIGADMLASWNFHPDLVQAVAQHHTPKGSLSRTHAALVDGDRIAHLIACGSTLAEIRELPGILLPNYVGDTQLETVLTNVRARSASMIADLF